MNEPDFKKLEKSRQWQPKKYAKALKACEEMGYETVFEAVYRKHCAGKSSLDIAAAIGYGYDAIQQIVRRLELDVGESNQRTSKPEHLKSSIARRSSKKRSDDVLDEFMGSDHEIGRICLPGQHDSRWLLDPKFNIDREAVER